ncbi:hypothetical protein RND61_15545 [Streptomyces sp. TRM76323]|uniref:Uncharacterized protein n=1 Tax=Streptomyces tamarix TaxID=3078565 RepID=A0ABU3QL43_9ACTN|nr:hypothetical protein [Streptomyces tamarix]MDT9683462.1 hypothetical protein [Streptomyces tamarix]
MKNVYVTELTFEDEEIVTPEQVIKEHGSDNWSAKDVAELLADLDYGGFSLDDDAKGIEVHINDFDELAKWAIEHGLVEYDTKNTPKSAALKKSDFTYENEEYKFVFLVADILADFLSEAINNIKSLDSFPTGIGIDKREV